MALNCLRVLTFPQKICRKNFSSPQVLILQVDLLLVLAWFVSVLLVHVFRELIISPGLTKLVRVSQVRIYRCFTSPRQ